LINANGLFAGRVRYECCVIDFAGANVVKVNAHGLEGDFIDILIAEYAFLVSLKQPDAVFVQMPTGANIGDQAHQADHEANRATGRDDESHDQHGMRRPRRRDWYQRTEEAKNQENRTQGRVDDGGRNVPALLIEDTPQVTPFCRI
jgi:hypothetical protein